MAKRKRVYTLMHLLDAATYESVDAATPEEALAKSEGSTPTVCHQCSDKVELSGEVLRTIVLLDGEEVLSTQSFDQEKLDAKDARIEELEARVRELRATLLEERYWHDWMRGRLSTAQRVARLIKHYAAAIRAGRV